MIVLVPNYTTSLLRIGGVMLFLTAKNYTEPGKALCRNYLYMDINQNNTRHHDVCYLIGVNGTT